MLNAIIVEDDPRDREVLEILLKKYCSNDVLIVGTAGNVEQGFKLITEIRPGLVFLDVELEDATAFDLLSKFSGFDFRVIFVTAYEKYAMQAIKFNALDYVLKPVEITELVKAVEKVRKAEQVSIGTELKNLIHTLAHPYHKSNRIAIPVQNGYKMVTIEDIQYCEAKKEYTYIYCMNQVPLCSSVNLGEYEELLHGYSFCRVHHSFLVNKDHVKHYVKGEGGEITTSNNTVIPVSRRKKPEVMEWLTRN
jgi:two-component system, LytTR family, response regulator